MYKGNMGEFIDKVSKFVSTHYGMTITLEKSVGRYETDYTGKRVFNKDVVRYIVYEMFDGVV